MDSSFLTELQEITGSKEHLTLPQIFIDGKYVGGAEEIKSMHENGDLKRLIEGLPLDDYESGICGICLGHRFILCNYCDGSHKVYIDGKVGFKNCGECNKNGLILCPHCTCVVY